MTCAICRESPAMPALATVLGSDPVCWTCFNAHAETPVAIHAAYQHLATLPRSSALRRHYRELIDAATCFDGFDTGYVPHLAYLEQKAEQVPAVIPGLAESQAEDDAMAERMARRAQEVRAIPEQLPPRRAGLFRRVVAILILDWSYVT